MNHLTAGKAAAVGVALACALLFEPHITAFAPPQATAPAAPAAAGGTAPPTAENSVRFAVLGDTGTGDRPQYEVAAQLEKSRAIFPFEFAIMVGDNMYGAERPQDYVRKFELPYKPMLDAKVQFFASLGNHDDPNQRFYKPFNMNGERYYTFKFGNPSVRFFALDSNYMTREQLEWIEKELANSDSPWKIAFFHHPLYSSGGRHGSEVDLREQLEPLFLKHGVNVVFAGHEHFYERIHPQKGIYYFTAGGSAKLRSGNIQKGTLTAAGFDTDRSYVLVEVAGDVMHFQALSRLGKRVDSGSITRASRTTTQSR
jgi:Calcineurin-like phosphoesterase